MNSLIALKLYCAKKQGLIKSNADFWNNYSLLKVKNLIIDTESESKALEFLNINVICAFDPNFPKIDFRIKASDKPYLFVYRGDINLLNEISNNVAVIGVRNPTKEIIKREELVVKQLLSLNKNIVSGLAIGCDTVAHLQTINYNKKTIAFLPSTIDKVYPKQNKKLIDQILINGGLVISEYIEEPKDQFVLLNRLIERDRLQAMFVKSVILIASFCKDKGDSGSRHAIKKAEMYKKNIFVMYNKITDYNNPMFGLNKEYVNANKAKILSSSTIKEV